MKKKNLLLTAILLSANMGIANAAPQPVDLNSGNYDCVSVATNKGEIVLALDKKRAPETVKNFLTYLNAKFYDGTIFHRVINGFMIQGGGFDAELNKKPTNTPIINEADNGLHNKRGTIAAARLPYPHTATSQFFINLVDNDFLNHRNKTAQGWGYAVFGTVLKGMDVVDNIAAVETGAAGHFNKDVPKENIVIEKTAIIACD